MQQMPKFCNCDCHVVCWNSTQPPICRCTCRDLPTGWPQKTKFYKQEEKMEKESAGIEDSRSRVERDMDVITKMVFEMKAVLDSITTQVNKIHDLKEVVSSLDLRDKHNNKRIEALEYNKKIMDMLPMNYIGGMQRITEPSFEFGNCPNCNGSGKIKL